VVDELISVEALSKKFCRSTSSSLWYGAADILREVLGRGAANGSLRGDEFYALRDISFTLRRGESLAVMGHNGAGKTTLLKLLLGRLKPTSGRIVTHGRIGAITDLGLGFDMALSGRENVYVGGALLGLSRHQLDGLMDQIVEFAGIGEFIEAPLRTYSTGMRARLGYAVAANLNPDVLLVDEALAVGDIAFRRKCIHHVKQYLHAGGALVWVSHDPYLVQSVCSRCILLDHGEVAFDGSAVEGVDRYFRLGNERIYGHLTNGHKADGRGPTVQEETAAETELPPEATKESEASHAAGLAGDCNSRMPAALSGPQQPEPASSQGAASLGEAAPVTIDTLQLVGEHGDAPRHGRPATVVLSYQSRERLPGVRWGFLLCTADLTVVITSAVSTREGGHVLEEGLGELHCHIPALPLRAGTYAVRAGLADCVTGAPLATRGWEDAPSFFTVASDVSHDNNTYATIGDLVSIDVVWRDTRPGPVAVPAAGTLPHTVARVRS
jgi:ABC-type polysaccharide/polyol phosphate transport system ATPase subunit